MPRRISANSSDLDDQIESIVLSSSAEAATRLQLRCVAFRHVVVRVIRSRLVRFESVREHSEGLGARVPERTHIGLAIRRCDSTVCLLDELHPVRAVVLSFACHYVYVTSDSR